MTNSNPEDKDILTVTEAIDYFVVKRREFYALLKEPPKNDFIIYYRNHKMIIRSAFEKYMEAHPELRRKRHVRS